MRGEVTFLHPGSLDHGVASRRSVALSIHALVDGMATGVSLRHNPIFGSVISIGVILHKFVDGLTRTSLLHRAHYYKMKEISLSVSDGNGYPLGAFLTYVGPGACIDIIWNGRRYPVRPLGVAAADLLPLVA